MKSFLSLVGLILILMRTEAQQMPSALFHGSHVTIAKGEWWPTAASNPTTNWKQWFSVYTENAFAKSLSPMAGTYQWRNDSLSFQPLFEFSPGERYHVVFDYNLFLDSHGITHSHVPKIEHTFQVSVGNQPETVVENIYPKSESLPENLLRLYIQFSQPIAPGEIFQHLHLVDRNGLPVESAFLIIDQELWSEDRKRFTLLFDPGRIKRGIRSNLELGSPLKKDNSYTLVVDSLLRDVQGRTLAKSFRKAIVATEAVRSRLDPKRWKIQTPKSNSKHLVIEFDRPIDFVLAGKCFEIITASGKAIPVSISIEKDSVLRFTPDSPWVDGDYFLRINPTLEDVAGNNINNPFDLDLREQKRVSSVDWVMLPFQIKFK